MYNAHAWTAIISGLGHATSLSTLAASQDRRRFSRSYTYIFARLSRRGCTYCLYACLMPVVPDLTETHRHTDTQTKCCNPRTCVPRVNNVVQFWHYQPDNLYWLCTNQSCHTLGSMQILQLSGYPTLYHTRSVTSIEAEEANGSSLFSN